MTEHEFKKLKRITSVLREMEERYLAYLRNKNQINDIEIVDLSKGRKYFRFIEYATRDTKILKKTLKKNIKRLKADLGEVRSKELNKCISSTSTIPASSMKYVSDKIKGTNKPEYTLVYIYLKFPKITGHIRLSGLTTHKE